jgi:hypothetical protein
MKYRSVRVCPSFGSALFIALALTACGSGGDGGGPQAPTTNDSLTTAAPECPDVCAAICNGEPEPELPCGCPTPSCAPCDDPGEPTCPNVCAALCAGEPVPELPDSCPTPACGCE